MRNTSKMSIEILPQPDDQTCGPTSLHAVYTHYGLQIELNQLISETSFLDAGGTLAVYLGLDAVKRGFKATIYSSNLKIFDPSWARLSATKLSLKLKEQLHFKRGKKITQASLAYISFLKNGGNLHLEMIEPKLIQHFLNEDIPILTGLSATYLYQSQREYTNKKNVTNYNDLKGVPSGHFVVLYGINMHGHVEVADPYAGNPLAENHHYSVEMQRLINAIHLGIMTYDANILIIEK